VGPAARICLGERTAGRDWRGGHTEVKPVTRPRHMARCFALLLAFAAMAPLPALATPPVRPVGASIYLDGILPGGGSAIGARVRLPALTGADAACAVAEADTKLSLGEWGLWQTVHCCVPACSATTI
jgi:hypothetical protein